VSDRQRKIYQTDGERYEALVSREDYSEAIPRAIDEIIRVEGLDVFDIGAGTGRLAVMLARRAKSIRAFDISSEMLRICRERLAASGLSTWRVEVADHRRLPVEDGSADLIVSGWSVSYLAVWKEGKTDELDIWLAEMKRVLRRDGVVILFESLGTGNETPVRLKHVESTYGWLDANGFQQKWIRTDYQFESVEEAVELAGFFFGDEMAECTGVWWTRMEG
jgi:ubiquinone/menaquinone biosynthesis C-methylase UbiE